MLKLLEEEDKLLIARCKAGDSEAFEKILKKYQDMVFRFSYRLTNDYHDANDLAQEAFIKAFHSIKKFRGDCSLGTWLYKVVQTVHIDLLRKRKKQVGLATYHSEQPWEFANAASAVTASCDEYNDPAKVIEAKERQMIVQRAINSLPAQYKSVIVLYELEGYSYEEISKISKVSIGTVKSRLNRARLMLKDKLKGELF